jgi:hypothetical protein
MAVSGSLLLAPGLHRGKGGKVQAAVAGKEKGGREIGGRPPPFCIVQEDYIFNVARAYM